MQNTTDQRPLLPIERELLEDERRYHIQRLQKIEKRLNKPSSLVSRELRRIMQRADGSNPDANPDCE